MNAPLSIAEEEVGKERQVLHEVLELHPATLSETELIRVLGADMSDAVGEVEPWKRAIRELCRHGLLRIDGESVFPTMAAVRASELFDR